jgi:polyisoprenoid-binding protein YceI
MNSSRTSNTNLMNRKITLLASVILFVASGVVHAQKPFTVKQAKMTVQGTSTLHEWESEATKLTCKGSALATGSLLASVKDVEVTVPVQNIKSTKGKTMDNKTWEAFTYTKYPNIIYKLTQATVATDGTVDANGTLTMAGVTKPVKFMVKSKVLPNGDIQLTGSHKLKMTEFKMVPPTAVMGTIKVGDEVTVTFDLTVTTDKIL